MADITVTESHNRQPAEVRELVEQLMGELEQRYSVHCEWQDQHTASFRRSGLSGKLSIGDREVTIRVRLGLLAGAFKQRVERELREAMRERLRP